jgi:hypothetical protein
VAARAAALMWIVRIGDERKRIQVEPLFTMAFVIITRIFTLSLPG